jgi:hypothetical protein
MASDFAGDPLAWITTASICCCSLARGCWTTVDMKDPFVHLAAGSIPAAEIHRLRPPDVNAHHMFDAISDPRQPSAGEPQAPRVREIT